MFLFAWLHGEEVPLILSNFILEFAIKLVYMILHIISADVTIDELVDSSKGAVTKKHVELVVCFIGISNIKEVIKFY